MSTNLVNLYAMQFSTNVALLLQQKGSKLRGAVTEGTYVGNQASPVDQIGSINANLVTGRFNNMPRTDAPVDRRWVFPSDFDVNQLIDSFDQLRLISNPTHAYSMNAVYALGRAMDDTILGGMFNANNTGVQGATSTAFDSTNQVVSIDAGGVNSGLNVTKLRTAKKILMANEVDLDNDPIYCAITSTEHNDLLNEIQVISLDFNDKPVMVGGKVQQFLGINFIHCERIAVSALGLDDQSHQATSHMIPMWAKSGVHLGIWNDIMVDVSQRRDIQGIPYQAYAKETIGATRLEEKKVVKIWSNPSA